MAGHLHPRRPGWTSWLQARPDVSVRFGCSPCCHWRPREAAFRGPSPPASSSIGPPFTVASSPPPRILGSAGWALSSGGFHLHLAGGDFKSPQVTEHLAPGPGSETFPQPLSVTPVSLHGDRVFGSSCKRPPSVPLACRSTARWGGWATPRHVAACEGTERWKASESRSRHSAVAAGASDASSLGSAAAGVGDTTRPRWSAGQTSRPPPHRADPEDRAPTDLRQPGRRHGASHPSWTSETETRW